MGKMKLYQKITLITGILGSIIPVIGVFVYMFINSIIGIPVLGLFLGGLILIAIMIIAINIAALVVAFFVKNTKICGIILISCGVILFASVQYWGIPGMILFVIAGIMAIIEKPLTDAKK